MGDKILLKDLQFLYGYLWQFDVVNESSNQQIRFFVTETELKETMQRAKECEQPAETEGTE
jgi:hypothetical protein